MRYLFLCALFLGLQFSLIAKTPDPEPIFIGVQLNPIDSDSSGVKVESVLENSPAALAGLKSGWIVLSIENEPLPSGNQSIKAVRNILSQCYPNQPLVWQVLDDKKTLRNIELTPISRSQWNLDSTKRLAKQIATDVERIRELSIKKEIDVNVMNRQNLHNFLKNEFEREVIEADLRKAELLLTRLGLQPEGIDAIALTLEVLKMGVLGFYHPKTKQLVLIEGQSGPMAESSMAHELTHAIQDQHFYLEKLPQENHDNSDLGTALRCVMEGDAKALELEYIKQIQNGNQDAQWLTSKLPGGSFIPPSLDPKARFFMLLEKELMLPYTLGTQFVLEAHRRGGWDAVNRLYDDWPTSSEQILHWEKYFDQREEPIEIEAHDFIDWADQDYEVIISDVMGELGTIWLFLNFVNRKVIDAEEVGAGWDGDRIIGLINKKDKKPVNLWMSLWETEKDATEFAEALKIIYQIRFPNDIEKRNKEIIAVDGDVVTLIQQQGQRVILCDGAQEQEAKNLIKQALKTTKIIKIQRNSFWHNSSEVSD